MCVLGLLAGIGLNFLGALVYTDDIVLLAPTPSAIRKLLNICDDYAREYSIIFNEQIQVYLLSWF